MRAIDGGTVMATSSINRPRVCALLMLVGGVVGAAVDQIHVQCGALTYRNADLLDQPWWVAPEFAIATLLMGMSLSVASRWVPLERAPAKRIGAGALWFVGMYGVSGLLYEREVLSAAVIGAFFVARLLRRRPTVFDWVCIGGFGLCGPAFESLWSSTGVFAYEVHGWMVVPIWLPLLYMHGAFLASDLANEVRDLVPRARS